LVQHQGIIIVIPNSTCMNEKIKNYFATFLYYLFRCIVFLLIYLLLYYIVIWEGMLDFIWKDYEVTWRAFRLPLIIVLSYYLTFNEKMKTVFWSKVSSWIEDKI
jgi:hypothetical protein